MPSKQCYCCGLYIRQETSSERRGILFGGDSPPPAADFERITGKAPEAPDSPWAHVKPSSGDCYKQCLAVVAQLRIEERDRLERAATMRQTRHAAAHAAPSPIPSFLPQPPREQGARPTAAARAAALAEEAEQFLGPRLSEMRIKGSSVMLVNMEVHGDLQRSQLRLAEEELSREQLSPESNLSTADVAEVESVLYSVLRTVEMSARAEAAAEQQKMKQTKPPPPLKATFAKMKRVELLKAARARADEIHALKTTLVKQSTRLEVLLEQKDEEVLTTMNELVARYEQELELLRERLLTFDECAERCAEGGLADLPSVLAESIVGGHIGMGSFYLRATDDQLRNMQCKSAKSHRFKEDVKDVMAYAWARQSPARAMATLGGSSDRPEQMGFLFPSVATLRNHVQKGCSMGHAGKGGGFGGIVDENVDAFLKFQTLRRTEIKDCYTSYVLNDGSSGLVEELGKLLFCAISFDESDIDDALETSTDGAYHWYGDVDLSFIGGHDPRTLEREHSELMKGLDAVLTGGDDKGAIEEALIVMATALPELWAAVVEASAAFSARAEKYRKRNAPKPMGAKRRAKKKEPAPAALAAAALAAAAPAVAAVVTPAAAAAKKRAHAQDEVHAQDELEGGPTEDGMDAALHALNDKSRLAADSSDRTGASKRYGGRLASRVFDGDDEPTIGVVALMEEDVEHYPGELWFEVRWVGTIDVNGGQACDQMDLDALHQILVPFACMTLAQLSATSLHKDALLSEVRARSMKNFAKLTKLALAGLLYDVLDAAKRRLAVEEAVAIGEIQPADAADLTAEAVQVEADARVEAVEKAADVTAEAAQVDQADARVEAAERDESADLEVAAEKTADANGLTQEEQALSDFKAKQQTELSALAVNVQTAKRRVRAVVGALQEAAGMGYAIPSIALSMHGTATVADILGAMCAEAAVAAAIAAVDSSSITKLEFEELAALAAQLRIQVSEIFEGRRIAANKILVVMLKDFTHTYSIPVAHFAVTGALKSHELMSWMP